MLKVIPRIIYDTKAQISWIVMMGLF